jgi:hypothetical protein
MDPHITYTTHTFKDHRQLFTFTVYRGQQVPQAHTKGLSVGDVFCREAEGFEVTVFVRTDNGWDVCILDPVNPQHNTRHPMIKGRVLVLEGKRFAWNALASLRSAKKRAADKARIGEGLCNDPTPDTNHCTTVTLNSDTVLQGEHTSCMFHTVQL